MKPGTASRGAARRIVTRVLRQGAYSNVVVHRETADLPAADARFAQRLAFDTIRYLLRVDRAIASVSSRDLTRIDVEVLDALRVGATELLFLDTAAHAAVDSTVEVARSVAPGAAGFCNAILRALVRAGEPDLPGRERGAALRLGQPLWIYRLLVEAWGPTEAEAFFAASQQEAPRTVRLRPGGDPHDLVALPGIPGAFRLGPDHPLRDGMAVQDGSSIAAGLALDPQPGDLVLDLAAAPGGKSLHIADLMGGAGMVVASDHHPRRVASAAARTEFAPVLWCAADGRRAPFRSGTFDRVLVDAPCSGLGTMRRRPEVRFRVRADGPARLAGRQAELLTEARRLVRPGGLVVYSVCTVTPQETIDVVASHPTEPVEGLPGRPWGKGWLLGPHLTGTDGMFIARLRERG